MNTIIQCANTHRSKIMAAKKLIYPAADRNKDPILSVLQKYIQRGSNQIFLEIASGSGQHIAHFAPHFPDITFYPSEYERRLLESIAMYAHGLININHALKIDITTNFLTWGNGIFKESSIDYIYNANMMHISPYQCTIGLFQNAGKLLKNNGYLFTYGPYAVDGKITPESNINFDKSLKLQDPSWGLRDIKDLKELAQENGIQLIDIVDMPANNKTIIWKKVLNQE
ncbi:methyltransferase-like 26 isoform X2 [Colletes gigas]|uniref:methyltransferase-like 26 isoform X2 n=1 Tax=Colletes gigas TaxID=935657 RepID=UPI001C9B8D74|nr:methyltransferase-like 26 isoform X2 [Colletes gigas]XP_043262571.1 methyltransferase-like 26 isoform X2 [Colletes gigas]XP_043262572.1 methyltransferase-like 26 isoform X2 [Colletes gigas]